MHWYSSCACVFVAALLFAQVASAEVVKIEIRRRDDLGTHERLIGRVHFAVDPTLPANRGIADLDLVPTNGKGLVEFAADVLFFTPKEASRARGTVFLEVVNRGRDQSLAIMSGAQQRDLSPESWNLGDRFLLEQGFTVAFLGWQFDVQPAQGLTFQAPIAPVEGVVRESYIETNRGNRSADFALAYCASGPARNSATLTFRARMDETPRPLPRDTWQFAADGCSVHLGTGLAENPGIDVGLYEVVYQAKGSPVAGLGLAAIRDFASYLRYGKAGAPLRESPVGQASAGLRNQKIIGYGYSQSARFLREFVRDGFNADERGRAVFDGLMIASAGAGGGSFNHRFAMPGQAGNSVLSVLRPVDLPPFTDDGLLAKARAARVTPKIFYTFSSTEYWARAGSLTHTSDEGPNDLMKDAPLAATSRLYFLAGTPHASGALPLIRNQTFQHFINFAPQRWAARALLLDLDAWIRNESEPPPSQYPSIANGELVALEDVHFPTVPSFPFVSYMPRVWRMDYGPRYATTKVITKEPPQLGAPYRVLVPQVNADGNDMSGVRLPEVAVPLGTYTGWNVTVPRLSDLGLRNLGYLSGLIGGFEPFARTKEQREQDKDARPSIAERYTGRQDYLDRVRQAAEDLVRQRFLRREDVPAVLLEAETIWNAVH
jgi:alpha/beta hydrolase family protein